MIKEQEALDYHSQGRRGKIEVVPTKPCLTQRDLSLAYTPGVAVPCLRIQANPDDAYLYTAKGNLVAVVTNGTAVLGLGDIGALAGKPVMEGKGILFKRFADIDVFDIEINTHDPDEVIRVVKLLEPTFGGINLEDIKAPECFYIEETLKRELSIPVFHDDQHGTAIISGAALLNALEIVGKRIDEIKVVFNGAGASGIACAKYYLRLGVKKENLILCDTKGVIYKGRTVGMNPWKEELAAETDARTLAEAMVGADVFVGLSVANCVTPEMVRSMAERPIVFAMANPDPEITWEEAKAARPDVIMATGRSDYPNQVNNVLGFPFIFRGALDVRATTINEEMKLAATRALAALAKEDVPDSVMKAYGGERLRFGPDYLIPKPLDHRVLIWEASAVAQAAMESGVARLHIDIEEYKEQLESRLGKSREVMRIMIHQARRNPKRVVFPEGENEKVLRAAHLLVDEGIARPVLLGNEERIRQQARELDIALDEIELIDPIRSPKFEGYAREFYELRQRKGVTWRDALEQMRNPTIFGAMMVRRGDADALIAGVTQHYPETIRPALQIIQMREDVSRVSGLYMMILKDKVYFFADTTVNIEPTAEELAEIALCAAEVARRFHIEPRIAMISFSNFGSARHRFVDKVREATRLVKERAPDLMVDGEMQADTAVVPELIDEYYPFSTLKGGANVLIFPDLQSANVAYKLVQRLGGAEAIGPILMGMRKPVHVLQRGCEVKDIVNMAAIAVVDAQEAEEKLLRHPEPVTVGG
ncbi:MAG TPA: phosphate acetyltransferase [Blastocatellia bacterium]|nr:phosphate acetyltransferase [Blastocatellia bacterium]